MEAAVLKFLSDAHCHVLNFAKGHAVLASDAEEKESGKFKVLIIRRC